MLVVEARRTKALGKEQGARRGQQGGHAIAGHVTGGERGLTVVFGDFQAIGIDGNVLGGRSEGHHNRNGNQPGQVFLRVTKAHADQAQNDQRLRQHQP